MVEFLSLMYPRRRLHPSDIGLILSYKCQCACAHCLYNCGPGWQDWMSSKEVREALDAMTIWGYSFQVHITGGEPFLNFPLALEAVEVAAELGIPCYIETNAGWCVREELVTEHFTALRQAGLQAILISCSPFHSETIPPKRTLLAIRKAQEIFGPRRVIVYLPEWVDQVTHFGIDDPLPLESYIEAYGSQGAGQLFWEGYGLISGGRSAYRLGGLTNRHPAAAFQRENCRSEILYAHHSHFDLYGNYISGFCGGLSVGSWWDMPQLLADFDIGRFPPLVEILVKLGAFGLFELARQSHGYTPSQAGYVGKCHLCVDVRRHLAQCEDFAELRPKQFYEMI